VLKFVEIQPDIEVSGITTGEISAATASSSFAGSASVSIDLLLSGAAADGSATVSLSMAEATFLKKSLDPWLMVDASLPTRFMTASGASVYSLTILALSFTS
jgi:hypothetical protein